MPEAAVAVTGAEHHKAPHARPHPLGLTVGACGCGPLPRVPTPVDVAQRRHVPGALSPWVVVLAWAERKGPQRIPDDMRGAGPGCRGCGGRRRFLLATYLDDLRLHALELGQQRGGLALQRRRLL